jgi:hypothetical protein
MVEVINNIRQIPNLTIIKTSNINQQQVFETLKNVCVGTTDVIVLMSADELQKNLASLELVTGDNKLLTKGKKMITTTHTSFYGRCQSTCMKPCRYMKR